MGCGASKTQPVPDGPGSPGHSDKHGHSHHSTGGQSDKHGHIHHSTGGQSDKHGHSHHSTDGHSDKHGHSHHSTGGQSDKHGHSHHSTDGHYDKHGHSHHSTDGHSDKHGHSHHSTDGHPDKHGHSHHHADATALILKTQSGVTSNHAGHDVNDILRPKHGEAASEKLSKIDQLFTNPHLHDDGTGSGVRHRRIKDDDDSIIQHDYTTSDLDEHHVRDIKHKENYDGARLVHANTHDGNNLHRALDESVTEQDLENYVSKHGLPSANHMRRHQHSALHDHTIDKRERK